MRRTVELGAALWLAMLVGLQGAPAAAATAGSANAATSPIEVKPGSVVRWSGAATTRCAMGGKSWRPLGNDCYFAVDLLAEGVIAVERLRSGKTERRALRVGTYPYPEQHIEIEDQSKVDLSPADLRRVEREEKEVGRLFGTSTARRFTLPLARPLSELPPGGRFGSRRWFNSQPRSPHTGADFAASAGTPVFAVAEGKVVLAAELFFSGNSVFVDHGDGLISMYFHFSKILVHPGQEVRRGTEIGRVGATGRASGPHLHLGIRWHGARVDPEQLLGGVQGIPEIP